MRYGHVHLHPYGKHQCCSHSQRQRLTLCLHLIASVLLFGISIELSLDGYASTLLSWKQGRGQAIPHNYTVRMATAPRIGGFVLDENGAPVSEAWIQFNLPEKLGRRCEPLTVRDEFSRYVLVAEDFWLARRALRRFPVRTGVAG